MRAASREDILAIILGVHKFLGIINPTLYNADEIEKMNISMEHKLALNTYSQALAGAGLIMTGLILAIAYPADPEAVKMVKQGLSTVLDTNPNGHPTLEQRSKIFEEAMRQIRRMHPEL